MEIEDSAAFRATYRATIARIQSGLGGLGEYGSVPIRPYRLSDWNRVLWSAFTRCAAPLFPPHKPVADAEMSVQGVVAGMLAGALDSPAASVDPRAFGSEVMMDISWAPGIFPLPGRPEEVAAYLDQLFEAIAEAKPVYVKTGQLLAVAEQTRAGAIDLNTRLTRPIALFFEEPMLGVPANRVGDAGWDVLRSAAEIALREMPVYPLAKAPDSPVFDEALPTLYGAIVTADEDGRIDPDIVYLMSPRANVLDRDGNPRTDVSVGATVIPVIAPSDGSRLSGMIYGLTAAAVQTLGGRDDLGAGNRPVALAMPTPGVGDSASGPPLA